jgi:hypothetical protein
VNTNGAAVESGIPQWLFTAQVPGRVWDVTADAQRFLWAAPLAQRTAQVPITVVLNWPEALKQRMPTK